MPSRKAPSEQLPSNSTSPVLANTVSQQKESWGQPTRVPSIFTDTVLPSPAPSDDVHPDVSNVVDLETEEEDPELRRLIDLTARYGGIDELERCLSSAMRPGSLPVDGLELENRLGCAVVPECNPPSDAQQDFPRKRSLGVGQSQNKRPRISTSIQQPLRSSEQSQPNMSYLANPQSTTREPLATQGPSLRRYLPILDNYVTSVGGATSLLGSIELPRIRLLKDACTMEDCFYLVLHQLYCLYSVEPQTVTQLPGFGQEHVQAFSTLAQLLLQNSMLPDHVTRWFASFPAPIINLLEYSILYQKAYLETRNFLSKLVRHWHVFQARCKQRMYPPLVEELVRELGLESCVFQRVAFTAVHRGIWGQEQSHWFQNGEDLFRQDQIDNQRRRSRINTAHPPTAAEIQGANEQLAKEYQRFRMQHLREVHTRSLSSINTQSSVNALPATRTHTQQRNFPSPHEQGRVLRPATGDSSQDHPGAMPSQPLAAVLASNSGPRQHEPPRLNLSMQTFQPPHALRSPYGNTTPVVPSSMDMPGVTTPQMRYTQVQSLRAQQQHLAPVNFNRTASVSVGVPSPASPGQSAWYIPSQPALETLPPGASGLHGLAQQHLTGGGYRGPYVMQYNSQMMLSGPQLLVPSANHISPLNSRPNSAVSALHQAHLRSPTLKAVGAHDRNSIATRLYQYIAKLALTPKVLDLGMPNHVWHFLVTRPDFEKIVIDTPSLYGAPPNRDVHPGSEMYRLRCIKPPSSGAPIKESEWVVADNVWPSAMIIDVNGIHLGLRRKQHYGRDLPIDLTRHIKEGINEVKVGLVRAAKDNGGVRYAIAVEVINVADHNRAMDSAMPVPAHEIFDPIKASLASDLGDDDLTVVNNDITIDLIDPFSARIFDTPARGRACLHRECFDHETFLQTRKSKSPGWPCMVDEWKCPICGADARPQSLIVDCFLAEIRDELAKQRLLDTRTIVIEEDGTWRPKVETGEDLGDGDGRHGLVQSAAAAAAAPAPGGGVLLTSRRESVVIELDDD
ncbi:MAG: hypothetical protein M1830_010098 [Pleopsidium flavum]|nr:MAG: hypothetical protein M1830_010098 [Pleopsidium flavum]